MNISSTKLKDAQADRREEVVHAAWRVVAAGGLSALTIRSIASELGCTTGVVMHYFSTKEDIVEEMVERLYSGLQTLWLSSVEGVEPGARLERLLLACLPLQPATQLGWKLAVALQAEALRSPAIATIYQRHHETFAHALSKEVAQLAGHACIARQTDSELAAARLMAIMEGIGTFAVLHPALMTEQRQRELVRDELERLYGAATPRAATQDR